MGAERLQSALAANRDVPETAPGPFQDCRDEVHIILFFDGTGNNKDNDEKDRKWSNVARLFASAYRAAQLNKNTPIYPVYIRGVGTTSNDTAAGWLENAVVWAEDNLLGGGAGSGGDRRMKYGMGTVNDRLRDILVANAKKMGGVVEKYAAENCDRSFGDLSSVLAKHRLIKIINLSIFGFSRGAALARAFSNRFIDRCTKHGSKLLYQGYPLRINFLGLFDTVASFGVPSKNARIPFTERELVVSPAVERCVHYIAAHELRFSFPVDLIRKNGRLAGDWVEKVFPGVHSDVGGGYTPNEQGINNSYARIPLREMMREALLSGVRIIGYDDLKRLHNQLFREQFECTAEAERAYARYMAACKPAGGAVEQQIIAHMQLYYSANGTMNRRRIETATERSRGESKLKSLLGPMGMASEVAVCRFVQKNSGLVRFGGMPAKAFAQYVKIEDWQLAAWDAMAPEGVVEFVSKYVHDSKVDFLFNAEPFSYFSSRGVEESSISVWQESGNWLLSKGTTASNLIGATVDTTEQTVRQKAQESATAASRAYEAAANTSNQAVVEGKRMVDALEKDAEKIYESGTRWIRQQIGKRE
jgi:hypothetical protein